jgi:putative membrane protein
LATVTPQESRNHPLRAFVSVLWRGSVMGAADVIPGVSGGTMALILGVYDRLLLALGAITRAPLRQSLRERAWRRAWGSIDASFLLALAVGIALSVLTLAGPIEHLLQVARPQVYAVFIGMILASAWIVGRLVGAWRPATTLVLVGAAGGALALALLAPVETPTAAWFMVVSGAIGICALVLPGISGAYLLVILGQYEHVLGAIADRDLVTLAPFAVGALLGLLTFTRLLSELLRRWPDALHAAMTGFLLGSLPRIWPWLSDGGELLMPAHTLDAVAAGGLALVGLALVLYLHQRGRRTRTTRQAPQPS